MNKNEHRMETWIAIEALRQADRDMVAFELGERGDDLRPALDVAKDGWPATLSWTGTSDMT